MVHKFEASFEFARPENCYPPHAGGVFRLVLFDVLSCITDPHLLPISAIPAMPVIGYLTTGSPESDAVPFLAAFRQGLGEIGYVEGRNVAIEYCWAEFQMDRLPEMAGDLVRRPVTAIAAIGGTPTALVAKAATSAIPVVFYLGVDPVEFGLVASLNRPGGNMTGVAALQANLVAKRVELLHELVSKAAVVALLINPANRYSETEARVAQDAASSLGLQLQ